MVAPHPDDETIGCGGRIVQAHEAGYKAIVVVATDGAASHSRELIDPKELSARRSMELERAMKVLGVEDSEVVRYRYPDSELPSHIASLAADLRLLIDERRPAEVYVTCRSEPHTDHAAAFVATELAIRDSVVKPRLLEYPIWLWDSWPFSRSCLTGRSLAQFGSVLVRRSVLRVDLDRLTRIKSSALGEYQSQLGAPGLGPGLPPAIRRRALEGPELFFVNFGGRRSARSR